MATFPINAPKTSSQSPNNNTNTSEIGAAFKLARKQNASKSALHKFSARIGEWDVVAKPLQTNAQNQTTWLIEAKTFDGRNAQIQTILTEQFSTAQIKKGSSTFTSLSQKMAQSKPVMQVVQRDIKDAKGNLVTLTRLNTPWSPELPTGLPAPYRPKKQNFITDAANEFSYGLGDVVHGLGYGINTGGQKLAGEIASAVFNAPQTIPQHLKDKWHQAKTYGAELTELFPKHPMTAIHHGIRDTFGSVGGVVTSPGYAIGELGKGELANYRAEAKKHGASAALGASIARVPIEAQFAVEGVKQTASVIGKTPNMVRAGVKGVKKKVETIWGKNFKPTPAPPQTSTPLQPALASMGGDGHHFSVDPQPEPRNFSPMQEYRAARDILSEQNHAAGKVAYKKNTAKSTKARPENYDVPDRTAKDRAAANARAATNKAVNYIKLVDDLKIDITYQSIIVLGPRKYLEAQAKIRDSFRFLLQDKANKHNAQLFLRNKYPVEITCELGVTADAGVKTSLNLNKGHQHIDKLLFDWKSIRDATANDVNEILIHELEHIDQVNTVNRAITSGHTKPFGLVRLLDYAPDTTHDWVSQREAYTRKLIERDILQEFYADRKGAKFLADDYERKHGYTDFTTTTGYGFEFNRALRKTYKGALTESKKTNLIELFKLNNPKVITEWIKWAETEFDEQYPRKNYSSPAKKHG